jgi:hypothetical protein
MKFCVRLSGITLAVALLVASAPARAEERPFHLRGAGQLALGEDGSGTFTASGVATHLGRWTNAGTIQFDPGEEPRTLKAAGELTYTAANGDTLHVIFTGVLDLDTGIGLATFIFEGGSGRFADAVGETEVVVLQNLDDGSFTYTQVGTIDF